MDRVSEKEKSSKRSREERDRDHKHRSRDTEDKHLSKDEKHRESDRHHRRRHHRSDRDSKRERSHEPREHKHRRDMSPDERESSQDRDFKRERSYELREERERSRDRDSSKREKSNEPRGLREGSEERGKLREVRREESDNEHEREGSFEPIQNSVRPNKRKERGGSEDRFDGGEKRARASEVGNEVNGAEMDEKKERRRFADGEKDEGANLSGRGRRDRKRFEDRGKEEDNGGNVDEKHGKVNEYKSKGDVGDGKVQFGGTTDEKRSLGNGSMVEPTDMPSASVPQNLLHPSHSLPIKVSSISTTNENRGVSITRSHEVHGKSSTDGTSSTAGKSGNLSLDALAKAKKALQMQKELAEKLKRIPLMKKVGGSSSANSSVVKSEEKAKPPSGILGPLSTTNDATTLSTGVVSSSSTLPSAANALDGGINVPAGLTSIPHIEAVKRAQELAARMGFRQDPEFAPLINLFPGNVATDVAVPQKPTKAPVLRLDALGREIDEQGNVVNITKPSNLSTLKVNINKQKKDAFQILKPELDVDPDSNPHFDERMGINKTKLLRPKRMSFQFVEEGKWSKEAETLKLRSKFGEAQAKERREKQAQLAKAKAAPDINPNLIEVSERVVKEKTKDPIPEIEWWDVPLLQSGAYKDLGDGFVADDKLRKDKITIYVEHPRPIEPPAEPALPPPQPLKLTKKEQKKLRTQRRLAKEKDRQEMIRQGLIEPPKPKVKMSNLMKVLGSEATQDPTKLEKEIRAAAAEREQAHIDRNIARKLSHTHKRKNPIIPQDLGILQNMGNADFECPHRVAIPPKKPFLDSLASNLKETFFPDDPFKQFKNQPLPTQIFLWLKYFIPILNWAPHYTLDFFKADLVAGITIASLAVPQGISYANLASIPPIIGLYSSFVPPLIYAMLGSSKDIAVGTVAVASLLMSAMLGKEVNPVEHPKEYVQLVFTATFFAGVFQASLGFLRLGLIVDFLSHATIVGFMGGAATVVCLQQLKGITGLVHFTHETDIVSVMRSLFTQVHKWRWESIVLGCCFLFFLLLTRYLSKKKSIFFWISALAPLTSVILGSLLVYLTHAEKHGVQVIGSLKKGLNPPSASDLVFGSPHLAITIKTGIIIGIIGLAEGVAVGRSFAAFKNYHIDGNKEMIAFGMMNIIGSCTSCYLTAGPFSRTAVNFNAGCKTAVSNIVMAIALMITLLFLTPFFHYTPLVVLSAIIITAMLGLINYEEVIHLWKIDKFDFVVCLGAYIGVVFGSVETGLIVAITLSLLRVLLIMARPRTLVLGNIPNSTIYRSVDQYPTANRVPGILILQLEAPIYFANSNYLRERLSRWITDEEERIKSSGETSLQYIILDISGVSSIDSSGISMLEELKKTTERKGLKLVLCNPRSEVIKKLHEANFIEAIGQEWIYLTVGEAVTACNFMLHTCKPNHVAAELNSPV